MKRYFPAFAVFLVCFGASPARACEPILPLAQAFSGTLISAGSLTMLGAAVALKAAAFVYFERRLRWHQAVAFMIVANVVSTFIGIGLSVSAAVPMPLFFLPIVYVLSVIPARRLVTYYPGKCLRIKSHRIIAVIMTLLYFLTWVFFGLAQGVIAANEPLASYWLLKFLWIYAALLVSIGLTTLWEEWVIAGLAARSFKETSWHASVLKANLVTFFVVMLYAAIRMLPARLHSSDFLVKG